MKERKQAKFSLSTSPWGTQDSGPFAKQARPAFEITTSFSLDLFRSERWEGVWRFTSQTC